uniref:Type IV pilus assembly PilZ n=1 Tax=Solibacter usitatus (strain Ellin6076) TaxID=234267 RepID=Q01TM3_SOLUE
MAGKIQRRVRSPTTENRAKLRFPLNLQLRYSVVDPCVPSESGAGRTIDMSSSGLAFTADKPLSIGQTLDLSIDWPVQLDGGVQLQLVVSGVVVRTAGALAGLRILCHEFRTRRGV